MLMAGRTAPDLRRNEVLGEETRADAFQALPAAEFYVGARAPGR